jgi:NitT/TauT family transport system permease protein
VASAAAAGAGRTARRALFAGLGVFVLVLVWEGYKAIDGRIFGWQLPARADDRSMPHVWTVLQRFTEPATRGSSTSVGMVVVEAAWYTFRIAVVGFAVGVLVGLALAVLMQRFKVAERGLLPLVILSQTVPLVALAPLVVGWGGRLEILGTDWRPWMSVAAIAGYLAFFPVSVGALRGLQSPAPAAVELMHSYAASYRKTLFVLRFPAALPYIVPAVKLGAAAAVVGAIVAEISTGQRGGIGRLIIEYSRQATSDPARVYTALIGAALLGLVVGGLVAVFDKVVMRHRPKEQVA